jgi:VanZ family protein
MFTATHIPMPPQPGESPVPDKLIHYLMYLVLGLLLPLWRGWTAPVSVAGGLKSLVLLGLYGGLDELLQIPVGRSAEWFDWLADLGGAATGLALHAVANRCRGSRADARPTERTA